MRVGNNTQQQHGWFQVSASIAEKIKSRQYRVEERSNRDNYPGDMSRPMMRGTNLYFELADPDVGTACGGIGLIHRLVQHLELAKEIGQRLSVLNIYLPYHGSGHVLNLIYNALCDGCCLEDLELRRQDEVCLNSLGAGCIAIPPRPVTSAGGRTLTTLNCCARRSTSCDERSRRWLTG